MIFLFKYISSKPDDEVDGSYDFEASESIFFANQTIQNACATQAILSVLLNKSQQTTGGIDIGASLAEFREFTQAFPPEVGIFHVLLCIVTVADTVDSCAEKRCRIQSSFEMFTTPLLDPTPSSMRTPEQLRRTMTFTTSLHTSR